MKRLFVVGLAGGRDGMTLEAKKALEQSEVICGYTAYADLIGKIIRRRNIWSAV